MDAGHALVNQARSLPGKSTVRVVVSALAILCSVAVGEAFAAPTMIRLGYQGCTPCHLSPQGGGLLTDYGKGLDRAQSLFAREYTTPKKSQSWRFVQDARAQFGFETSARLATDAWSDANEVRAWHRAAVVHGHQRLTTVVGFDFRPLPSTVSARPEVTLARATWDVRPREGVEFSAGKDALPSPLGLPDVQKYVRDFVEPGASLYPSQAKLFLSSRRTSLTSYAFGPGGDETVANRSSGAGVLAGLNLGRRVVLGGSARASRSTARDVNRSGAFARLGFGRWGLLSEHERVIESDTTAEHEDYVGTTVLFTAPFEWLVASVASQYSVDLASRARDVHRLSPSVQIRVSDNITFAITEREMFGPTSADRGRSLAIQLFMKTVR